MSTSHICNNETVSSLHQLGSEMRMNSILFTNIKSLDEENVTLFPFLTHLGETARSPERNNS
jgi:hypothetical protein